MSELSSIVENGHLEYEGKKFLPSSKENLKEILPYSYSPTWKLSTAGLRDEFSEEGTTVCIYGYKSFVGHVGSKIGQVTGGTSESMRAMFDYPFMLEFTQPAKVEEVVKHSASDASVVVDGKIDVAVLIAKDPSMKELLAILGLINNKKIGSLVLQNAYLIAKEWAHGDKPRLAKIENAYEKLKALLLR